MKKSILSFTLLLFCNCLLFGQSFQINVIEDYSLQNTPGTFCETIDLTLNGNELLIQDECSFASNLTNVESGKNVVTANTEIGILFNMSTLDLVLAYKGITDGFESVYQAIAADFDNDQTVSTDDIILMRQVILGNLTEYPAKARIVRSDHDFSNFNGLEFDQEFTSVCFDESEVQNNEALEVILIAAGSL